MSTETENFEIPNSWKVENGQLSRQFKFSKYMECVDFTNKIAKLAEERNHHPSITLEYSTVAINLVSHDKGAVTQRDIEFAAVVNQSVSKLGS